MLTMLDLTTGSLGDQIKDATARPTTHEPASASSKCHLLSLPPEVRNEIYKLAVAESEIIFINGLKPGNKRSTYSEQEPGLLRTCHEIRNDALGIYSGLNCFKFIWPVFGSPQLPVAIEEMQHIRGVSVGSGPFAIVPFDLDIGKGLANYKLGFDSSSRVNIDMIAITRLEDGKAWLNSISSQEYEKLTNTMLRDLFKVLKGTKVGHEQ